MNINTLGKQITPPSPLERAGERFHSITENIRYRWKAYNRHGVHSPFAYALVEDVIEDRKHIASANVAIPWTNKPAARYDALLKRMIAYYKYTSVVNLASGNREYVGKYDVLLMDNYYPHKWQQVIEDNQTIIGNDSVVILTNIHSSTKYSEAWQQVCGSSIVRMSLDLYDIGLLFFKKEFMIKQHFVLKGPK